MKLFLAVACLVSMSSVFAAEGSNSKDLQWIIKKFEGNNSVDCKMVKALTETGRGICIVTDDFCLATEKYVCSSANEEEFTIKAVFSNGYRKVPVLKSVKVKSLKTGEVAFID